MRVSPLCKLNINNVCINSFCFMCMNIFACMYVNLCISLVKTKARKVH